MSLLMAQVSITAESSVVTLINVFTVHPGTQHAVAQALAHATEEVMRHQPGFVSASIHESLDGTVVTNYAQWRTREDFEAMQKDPAARQHMAEIAARVASVQPVLYRVSSVHAAHER
jgi:heme-degrading monooxygenase HmoA